MPLLQQLNANLSEHRGPLHSFFRRLIDKEQSFMLRTEFGAIFEEFANSEPGAALADDQFAELVEIVQEAAVSAPWIALGVRPSAGRQHYLLIHCEAMEAKEINAEEFLKFKERVAQHSNESDHWLLNLDLGPFNREFPRLRRPRSIGSGVQFLNRHLSSQLFKDMTQGHNLLFKFLRVHQYRGRQLMINNLIEDADQLRRRLFKAQRTLAKLGVDQPWEEFAASMNALGFEVGWGDTAGRVMERFELLGNLLEAPDHQNLEALLARVPMIFDVAIISPHGFFGQDRVLGMPDTGGQIVYILNQVVALENEMTQSIKRSGLDAKPRIVVITRLIPDAQGTNCDMPYEQILGTQNASILRIPFLGENGETIQHWISRFNVYPYLERFSLDAENELQRFLGKLPDLVIGNYTDGNLVATLLSNRLGVTQCNIAHALEKTKYLYSALYWRELENDYHFSCQFTADLIAMNAADFIITSTYQEIAGDEKNPGQYESYSTFTMPGLYRVLNGIDVFDPKFNIVSPGADPAVFFPYDAQNRRFSALADEIRQMIHGEPDGASRGHLADDTRPIIFSMARMDKVKNLTGLAYIYANSPELRSLAKLVIVGGHVDLNRSGDDEERGQIQAMHNIMDEFALDSDMRWLGIQLDKQMTGEIYRVAADSGGAFVQPALYEAFGLTVVEAMATGLPTFATCYGGPAEIIEDGISGFHIDPMQGEGTAAKLTDFFSRCRSEPGYWRAISRGGIERVEKHYTWRLYAQRLMTLARVYGFWKFSTDLERQETNRYLEMFYGLMFRPLARGILGQ